MTLRTPSFVLKLPRSRRLNCQPISNQFWSGSGFLSDENDSLRDKGQLYSEQRLLGYSCEQIFSVVSEVDRYHTFVPWCKKSIVTSRSEGQLKANLIVGFPPLFGEEYTSTVTLIKPNIVTAVCSDLNMFKHLKTVWKFKPVEDDKDFNKIDQGQPKPRCQLDFAVSFAFNSSVHSYFSKLFFDEVIRKNVTAFLVQAEHRYGRESIPRQRPIVYAKR